MGKTVRTPIFRASYVHLTAPKKTETGRYCYSIAMIFEKSVENDPEFRAMIDAVMDVVNNVPGGAPDFYRWPFREGVQKTQQNPTGFDLKKHPYYEGKIIVTANSYTEMRADGTFDPGDRPGIVGANPKLIWDPNKDPVYSGMYARASVSPYWYKVGSSPGVAFGLNNVQKCGDGEAFGRMRENPENEFDEIQPVTIGQNHDLMGGFSPPQHLQQPQYAPQPQYGPPQQPQPQYGPPQQPQPQYGPPQQIQGI